MIQSVYCTTDTPCLDAHGSVYVCELTIVFVVVMIIISGLRIMKWFGKN